MRRNAEFYHQLPNDPKREVRMEPEIWPECLLRGKAPTAAAEGRGRAPYDRSVGYAQGRDQEQDDRPTGEGEILLG